MATKKSTPIKKTEKTEPVVRQDADRLIGPGAQPVNQGKAPVTFLLRPERSKNMIIIVLPAQGRIKRIEESPEHGCCEGTRARQGGEKHSFPSRRISQCPFQDCPPTSHLSFVFRICLRSYYHTGPETFKRFPHEKRKPAAGWPFEGAAALSGGCSEKA